LLDSTTTDQSIHGLIYLERYNIVDYAGGPEHTIFLTKNGTVYTIGRNSV
jgi:alpha-tubulin suppressor-like RCC1 family protein